MDIALSGESPLPPSVFCVLCRSPFDQGTIAVSVSGAFSSVGPLGCA